MRRREISMRGTMGRKPAVITAILLLLFAAGCFTVIGTNRPMAVEMTVERARADLECPEVKASVLSEKIVRGEPSDGSEHTIRVRGCGRQAVYATHCSDDVDCTPVIKSGQHQKFAPEVLP